jgi:hypothetical protein
VGPEDLVAAEGASLGFLFDRVDLAAEQVLQSASHFREILRIG